MAEKNGRAAAVSRFLRHRQHPIKILDYTSRNLWLLLIPLTKQIIADRFNFQEWLRTNMVEILTVTAIFGIALLRWIFVSFDIDSEGITAKTGLFGMVRTKVYFSEMTTVSFCQSWLNRTVRAHTIYVETNAKTVTKEDIRLVISQKNADMLFDFISSSESCTPKATFSPRKSYLFIFSLLFSSALSGMILYGTFMFEAYKIIGLEMEQQVLERLNGELTRIDERFLKLSETIPKAVLLLAGAVLLSWLISFITTLARHWSFVITRSDEKFFIKSGALIKRRHIISRDKINYYDLTQTLLMKIFKICSVTLNCTGYGKSRREISALIPITTYEQMNASLKMLVPELPRPRPEIRTGKADIMRFIFTPVLFTAIPPAAIIAIKRYFPDVRQEVTALFAIITVPLIWLCAVKVAAAFNTSVGFSENGCSLSYCKMYKFHKLFLPKSNISMIRITRNPFQLLNNTCTLIICTAGEKTSQHRLKFMPYDEIRRICLREGFIMFE